jgi:hypothetical protein
MLSYGWGGVCIFCGGVKLSKEHAFAKWLHPHLPMKPIANHEAFSEHILLTHTDSKVKVRSGDPHSGTVRVVCETCNTGWMSSLQEAARPALLPMVQGKRSSLHKRHLQNLCGWVAMFVMVNEWREKNRAFAGVSQEERSFLMENGVPPKTWKIWIGELARPGGIYHHTSIPVAGNGVEVDMIDGIPMPNTQVTTVSMGPLFIHAFSSSYPRASVNQRLPAETMSQVWPIRHSPVTWPPHKPVSQAESVAIAESIVNYGREKARRLRITGNRNPK